MKNSILYNFHDIYIIVKNNIRFVAKTSLLFLIISILYTLASTKYYESHISVYPDNDDKNSINNLLGIAGAGRFQLGDDSKMSFYIPDVIDSRRLKLNIIEKKWNSEEFSNPVNLIEYWGIDKKTNFNKENSYATFQEDAIDRLGDNLYVFEEEESGLIKIRVLMEEPQLAADIANYISDFLVEYIGTELKLKSTKYRQFLEIRLIEIEDQLRKAEDALAHFRTQNPIAKDTPELQTVRGQLIRDLEVEQQVYLTLRNQYEIARGDELKEKPVINILDYGYPSTYPYWPKNLLIYSVSLFIGFMFSIMILTSVEALSRKT